MLTNARFYEAEEGTDLKLDMLISNPVSTTDISMFQCFVSLMFMGYICNKIKTNESQRVKEC